VDAKSWREYGSTSAPELFAPRPPSEGTPVSMNVYGLD
jgi:hypothetical protein